MYRVVLSPKNEIGALNELEEIIGGNFITNVNDHEELYVVFTTLTPAQIKKIKERELLILE